LALHIILLVVQSRGRRWMGILVQKCTNQPCMNVPPPTKSTMNDDEIVGEGEDKVGNPAARLNAAIADIVHAHGLPFTLSENGRFRRVIRLTKFAPPNYEPPKRKLVDGRLLTANHEDSMHHMYDQLALQADTFGCCLLGDGTTVERVPLMNVLADGVHEPEGVVEIAEYIGHNEIGGKKDARSIANIFLKNMANIGPIKTFI
jgi:hypothetical protein